jgi:triosephosphate isomerase
MRHKLAAGNWKMNGLSGDLAQIEALMAAHPAPKVEMLICPPATLLARMAETVGDHPLHGARYVILGHSERRTDHGETDAMVKAKAEAARTEGLVSVICVGETLAERESGETLAVVGRQLEGSLPEEPIAADVVIAYEPVWAIGTGKVPTTEQIAEVHGFLRSELKRHMGVEGDGVRFLYGGSVKAANAAEIFAIPDVDGALVGGASLTAGDFSPIVTALENA